MTDNKELIETLLNLDRLDRLNIAYDDNPDFIDEINKLYEIISSNIENIDQIFDSLDLNKPTEKQIVMYIPKIMERLEKPEDKIKLYNIVKKQQEKYPKVSFDSCLYYSKLAM